MPDYELTAEPGTVNLIGSPIGKSCVKGRPKDPAPSEAPSGDGTKETRPSDYSIGEKYQRFEIQPGFFCTVNRLDYLDGAVIKRICSAFADYIDSYGATSREYDELKQNAIEELRKARHEIDLILQWRFHQ